MSDSTVGPRAEDAPSPKEEEPLSDVAPGTTWGEKLSVPGVPSKPLSDVVNRAFANPEVEGWVRALADQARENYVSTERTLAETMLAEAWREKLNICWTGEPHPVEKKYAGIRVYEVRSAPVDTVYLLDLEKLPSLDMLLDEMRASLTSDLGAVMEDLLVQGRVDVDPPSPETFALDLERFVMNTAPGLDARRDATTQVPEPQRAVCSMSIIRAALDGFGEPASEELHARGTYKPINNLFGEPCFLCDATPCICGRAL